MCSCPVIVGMVDFRNFATIGATVIDAPLRETESWLR